MSTETYDIEALQAWRSKINEDLRSDSGWLTVAGLHWLREGENSVGSDAALEVALPTGSTPDQVGVIVLDNGSVHLNISTAEPVTVDDAPAAPQVAIPLLPDSHPDGPTMVRSRDITFYIIERDGQLGVRVKDKNNPARQQFTGRRWYDADAQYRVIGTFTAHPVQRSVKVATSNGLNSELVNPGTVAFMLHGRHITLEAVDGGKDKHGTPNLWLIFRDATSGKTTYPACRFMYAPLHEDNSVVLDFNRAYSPPCAFTDFATCPLPPQGNTLDIAIEAGEQFDRQQAFPV